MRQVQVWFQNKRQRDLNHRPSIKPSAYNQQGMPAFNNGVYGFAVPMMYMHPQQSMSANFPQMVAPPPGHPQMQHAFAPTLPLAHELSAHEAQMVMRAQMIMQEEQQAANALRDRMHAPPLMQAPPPPQPAMMPPQQQYFPGYNPFA